MTDAADLSSGKFGVVAYHHGDLRAAIITAAAEAVARDGVTALSLRALAATAGVSHAALRHHFGDKRGLLTALATQGYRELAQALSGVTDLLSSGVEYVFWAVEHPGHYAVMFHPEYVDSDDADLLVASRSLARALTSAASPGGTEAASGLPGGTEAASAWPGEPFTAHERAAWSIAHGLAALILAGNFPCADVRMLARETLVQLGPPR